MKQYVSVLTLGVSDLGRARAFHEALVWRSASPPDSEVAFFQSGGMVLSLWGREHLAEDSGVELATGYGAVMLAHNVASPEEVREIIGQARGAGATVTREPGETFWGGYSGVFADPDGHPWEFAHNPHWDPLRTAPSRSARGEPPSQPSPHRGRRVGRPREMTLRACDTTTTGRPEGGP
jgi:predicted lactoylglutathione lyase